GCPPPPSATLFPYTTLFRSPAGTKRIDVTAAVRCYAHDKARQIAQLVRTGAVEDGKEGRRQLSRAPFDDRQRGGRGIGDAFVFRSEEHTSELQSRENLVCRL